MAGGLSAKGGSTGRYCLSYMYAPQLLKIIGEWNLRMEPGSNLKFSLTAIKRAAGPWRQSTHPFRSERERERERECVVLVSIS